jgi:glucodextranase-like protein
MSTDAKPRRALRWAAIVLATTIIAPTTMTACGGAGSPHAVSIALTAPTEGATLDESRIKVFGTADPSSASVDIARKRVHVAGGSFARWMTLRRGLSHIRIVATAAGYAPARMDVAVTSSPSAPSTQTSTSTAPAVSETTPSPTPAAPAASHYQPTLRANFLRTCKAAAGDVAAADARCECALAYIEARVPEATFAADERALLEGRATLPSWSREAGLACRAA